MNYFQEMLKSTEHANGRTLLQNADNSIKNMKKAWSFAQKYLNDANMPKVSGDFGTGDVLKSIWWHVDGVK